MTATELTISPRERRVGNGTVQRLLPYKKRRTVGPFIFLDRMGPVAVAAGGGAGIDAHPHIGLSTLSYLFEGRLVHRDSTGAVQTVEPGAVNWMTAGAGVTHTERSHPDDLSLDRSHHGLQLWVALPGDAEDGKPFFSHTAAADIPSDSLAGVAVRVAAGTGFGMESPVPVSSSLLLAEVDLGGAGLLMLRDEYPERSVLALDGDVSVGGETLAAGHLAILRPGAVEVAGTGRVMVLAGEPLGERHIWWNFVHSDMDRIEQAKADWTEQRFPKVPNDHDPWVPLPR